MFAFDLSSSRPEEDFIKIDLLCLEWFISVLVDPSTNFGQIKYDNINVILSIFDKALSSQLACLTSWKFLDYCKTALNKNFGVEIS